MFPIPYFLEKFVGWALPTTAIDAVVREGRRTALQSVYSISHSYEVHNGGILGNSYPPLTPPRRGIEVLHSIDRLES